MAPSNSKSEKKDVDDKKDKSKKGDKENSPEVEKKKEPEPPKKEPALIAFETIRDHLSVLEKAESHVVNRVLSVLYKTRKSLDPEILHRVLCLHTAGPARDEIIALLPPKPAAPPATPVKETPMEVDGAPAAKVDTTPAPITLRMVRGRIMLPARLAAKVEFKPPESEPPKGGDDVIRLSSQPMPIRKKTTPPPVEADLYIHLLCLLYLVDQGNLASAEKAVEALIRRIDGIDKRGVDAFAAKAFFYLALIYERNGKLEALKSYLSARLRAATLRRQSETQATLIFTLLRLYLIMHQWQSAAKLVDKVVFPVGASNNDLARFLYYQGRIMAMKLNYTAASGYFLQAMRKAPQEAAIGFKQNTQKWVVVVGLLQGEIPERSIFRQPIYHKCLVPYLELTQAVRLGDLAKFNEVLKKYAQTVFEKDETMTVIVRLRQNVIKTAVRQISLAYSRISISDICKKLQLASDVETEYMVAKAIADGAIEATVTCGEAGSKEAGLRFMQSSETADVYRTSEPQMHFDSRIKYCLELHNQAVKALRYPPKSAAEIETIEQQREREQQELEFAKGMAEDDDDDF